jgi:hypothetical protein
MEILIWLLVALLMFTPRGKAEPGSGGDRLRSTALLITLVYLIAQATA